MIDLAAISAGLKQGEFFLQYMPTVSLDDGRCMGAEALVRWRRGAEIISPLAFIPLIENTPLSGLVTYWVIETAAKELGDWLHDHNDIHLSINVPPEILGRGGLEYAASKAGLTDVMKKIVLEVTERGVPDKLGVDALAAATRRGARVALDDVFLSGANMVVLSRCNVEIIKLDKEVIAQIRPGAAAPDFLAGLAALMKATKIDIIAEGVETAEQVQILKDAGIKMAQGYHFSMPLVAADFLAFFDKRRV